MLLGRLAGADKGAVDPTISRLVGSLEALEPRDHRLILRAALHLLRRLIPRLIWTVTG